jgi:hypothetical protein
LTDTLIGIVKVNEALIRESASTKVSLLCTDKRAAKYLNREFSMHESLDQVAGTTLSARSMAIEGFWSQTERGLAGAFHEVSAKYLPS